MLAITSAAVRRACSAVTSPCLPIVTRLDLPPACVCTRYTFDPDGYTRTPKPEAPGCPPRCLRQPSRRLPHRVPRQMNVPCRRLHLPVPQERSDHGQTFAQRQRSGCVRVAEVVEPYTFETRALAHSTPRVVDVALAGSLLPPRKHPRVARSPKESLQHLRGRRGPRHHTRSGLAVDMNGTPIVVL